MNSVYARRVCPSIAERRYAYPARAPRVFAREAALASELFFPCTRQPPPSVMRPTFFTSKWTMCPGCFAVIVLISRFVSPFGSMNRRRFSLS